LRGFGTDVIDDVEVRIKVLRVSRAGRYRDVSGSYNWINKLSVWHVGGTADLEPFN